MESQHSPLRDPLVSSVDMESKEVKTTTNDVFVVGGREDEIARGRLMEKREVFLVALSSSRLPPTTNTSPVVVLTSLDYTSTGLTSGS
ncbi:unnamed protein product [Microthlaspi erraticum]|uniref:Uncharacterized protein n=1 Tax=Microthlaspi erraticum TaxID=1685480 RepID=A0A6D2KJY6_9BRAS|nr:unnamed protein product [Microthlaspi erraticum]